MFVELIYGIIIVTQRRVQGGTAVELKRPEFIMFDYGQTLIKEGSYDGAAGFDRILRYALANPKGVTGADLQAEEEKLNAELGRFNPAVRHKRLTEISVESVNRYLFSKFGIEFPPETDLRDLEPEFWETANPCEACEGIAGLLEFLREEKIRTGVVSNISFCGKTLEKRIAGAIPNADFEFVISSCDYLFRKPCRHIFETALSKAGVTADKVWFCGDQFVTDIQGSSAVGMTPVWYKGALRYDSECKLTEGIEIYGWNELIDIIKSL